MVPHLIIFDDLIVAMTLIVTIAAMYSPSQFRNIPKLWGVNLVGMGVGAERGSNPWCGPRAEHRAVTGY